MVMLIPPAILGMIHIDGTNDRYSEVCCVYNLYLYLDSVFWSLIRDVISMMDFDDRFC